jgi:DNA-binding NarL/FixJ family response regulator
MSNTTILVIDEHPDVCELLTRRLDSMLGFEVVAHTTSPLVAAELAHQWQPDIIVADLKKSSAFAAQAYGWLKKMSPESQLVVLTSSLRNGDEELFLEAGAAKCLFKDSPVKDLARELQEVASARMREDGHV